MNSQLEPAIILERNFGFKQFRPGQQAVINALLNQKTALAVFPTGAGKSLCYQLPALMLDGLTLVVSPLIALMKNQIDFLQSHGIAAARLDSSLSAEESREINRQMENESLKILYVAPERFNNERFLARMKRLRISLFAIDEAHCISEWGHNFRPDYLKLAETAQEIGAERLLALTATATPSVVKDICSSFHISSDCAIVTGFYRSNLKLAITPVEDNKRDELLRKRLRSRSSGSTIIYVTLQKTAERLALYLDQDGLEVRAYHAGMETEERTEVQNWWMAGENRIVTATIAFGMGIDKADVRYVYHYNMPKSLESYSQEIGRAGRDDKISVVEMLLCERDISLLENFAYGDTPTYDAVKGVVTALISDREEREQFEISLYELSGLYDMRILVLRTLLTYLELEGFLKQGSPKYTGYSYQLKVSEKEIVSGFSGEAGQFIAKIFSLCKKGRTWYRINPEEAAAALGQERRRVVRALETLDERGLIQLTASDVRHQFILIKRPDEIDALTQKLLDRFLKRELREIERIQETLRLAYADSCQSNLLASHFGEEREEGCGHCTFCVRGRTEPLSTASINQEIPADLDISAWNHLKKLHASALSHPRQAARYLCGITSPAITKAKISREPLFGAFAEYPFRKVLDWCETE